MPPDPLTADAVDIDGVSAVWLTPEGASADQVIVYFHGGGYVACSVDTHRGLMTELAVAAGCRCLGVDYRLAPQHRHPAAVTDAVAAYRFVLDRGYPPEGIVLAGDSAGGGLVLGALVVIKDSGLPMPVAAMTLSPLIDLEATGESMVSRAETDKVVTRDVIRYVASEYLGDQDRRQPTAAPMYADMGGFPPLYIQVGDSEVLLSDSTRLAALAQAAGVDVSLDVFPEMQHVFQMRFDELPAAAEAIRRLGAFARERLAGPA